MLVLPCSLVLVSAYFSAFYGRQDINYSQQQRRTENVFQIIQKIVFLRNEEEQFDYSLEPETYIVHIISLGTLNYD